MRRVLRRGVEVSPSLGQKVLAPAPYRVVHQAHRHAAAHLELQRAVRRADFKWRARGAHPAAAVSTPKLHEDFRQPPGEIGVGDADVADRLDGAREEGFAVVEIDVGGEEAVEQLEEDEGGGDEHL